MTPGRVRDEIHPELDVELEALQVVQVVDGQENARVTCSLDVQETLQDSILQLERVNGAHQHMKCCAAERAQQHGRHAQPHLIASIRV